MWIFSLIKIAEFYWLAVRLKCYKRNNINVEAISHKTIQITQNNCDMVKHKLQVTSWKLKSTSWNSKVQIQIHELWVQIHESLNQWKLKSSLFPKVISPKLLPNSWSNLHNHFLVIISCFTFLLLHGYGFSRL